MSLKLTEGVLAGLVPASPFLELYLGIVAQGREGLGLAFRTELGTFMALNS